MGQTLIDLNGANASTSTLIKSTVGLTAKTIALTAAETALNFALNAGVGLVIGLVADGMSRLINAQQEVTDRVTESTEELKKNTEEIDEYKTKILSLRENLESGTLSFDEQKSTREQLMAIQDEMIGKYGAEIKLVDLLKDSVDSLSKSLDELSLSEAEDWFAQNETNGLDDIIKNVEDYGVDSLDNLKDVMAKAAKAELNNEESFKRFWKENMSPLGAPDSVYKEILKSRKDAVDFGINRGMSRKDAEEQAGSYQKYLTEYLDSYYQALTNQDNTMDYIPKWLEKLSAKTAKTFLGDSGRWGFLDEDIQTYKEAGQYLARIFDPEVYNEATNALSKYNQALSENDVEAQKIAKEDLRSVYNNFVDTLGEVPEKYQGVIGYYFDSLMGDIVKSSDETINKTKSTIDVINGIFNHYYGDTKGVDSFLPSLVDVYDELSNEEISTLIQIIQGQINDGNIDWFASMTPENIIKKLDNIKKAESFDFADFFNVRTVDDTGKTLKEIIDDQVNPLKTAYQTLSDGEALDTDFYMQFPDLLQYADDVDNLKVHILELINVATSSSLKELRDMYDSTDDENIKSVLEQAMKLLTVDIQINDEYKEKENLIKRNVQALDGEINAVNKEIEAQKEEKEVLEKQKELLEEQAAQYESAAAAVTRQIDKQIEALERQKAAVEEYYDKQIEALKDEAEERDRNNKLREKELELEKAKSTKVRRYSASRGWVIESDSEAISEKQKEYDDLVREYEIEDLEKEKEAALANYDAQIEAWNNYKDSWQEAIDAWKNGQDEMNAAAVFGADWREQVANRDVGMMNQYKTEYGKIEDEIENITNNKIKKVDEEIENLEKKLNVYENLKNDQQEYLDFYKNYSSEFANATKEQTKSLKEFGEILERYRDVDGFIDMFKAYEEMKKQFDENYEGQGEKYSDKDRDNAKYESPKTVNSSAQNKLNSFLNSKLMQSIPTSVNAAFSKTNTVFNGLPNKDYNYAQTKVNNNSGVTYNQRTWNMNGSVIVDSYDKFKEYFDRYVREAKQDLVVGR